MTLVRMLTHMTSVRYDNQPWPAYHETFDVPDWEAEHLVKGGNAELASAPKLDRGYDVLRTPDPDYESGLKLADGGKIPEDAVFPSFVEPEEAPDFDNDFERGDDDNEVEDVTPQVKRPSTVDSKDMWVDYAVSKGADRETARSKTKKMLIADY